MVHNGEKRSLSKNITKAHYLPKLKQVFELDMHSWMIKQNFRLETNLCNASIHIVCKMGPISIQTTIKPDKVNDKIMNYMGGIPFFSYEILNLLLQTGGSDCRSL